MVEQSRQGLTPVNRRVMSLFQQMERNHLLRGSDVQGEGDHVGEGRLVDQEDTTGGVRDRTHSRVGSLHSRSNSSNNLGKDNTISENPSIKIPVNLFIAMILSCS